jgi:hypothetical protein
VKPVTQLLRKSEKLPVTEVEPPARGSAGGRKLAGIHETLIQMLENNSAKFADLGAATGLKARQARDRDKLKEVIRARRLNRAGAADRAQGRRAFLVLRTVVAPLPTRRQ